MLERVCARASRRCPAPAPGVRGAPGSSQHAKCSVGPVGEQVELSASPRRPAASAPRRGSARWPTARFVRSRHETNQPTSGAPALLTQSVPPPPPRSRLERSACRARAGGRAGRTQAAGRQAGRQRGVEALRALCGWVVMGWVTARLFFVGRLPRIWGSPLYYMPLDTRELGYLSWMLDAQKAALQNTIRQRLVAIREHSHL